MYRNFSVWFFLPLGLVVGWASHGQTVGMTVLLYVTYGSICTFIGCLLSVKHYQENFKSESEALVKLRNDYQKIAVRQANNMRTALVILSTRALRNSAHKMIHEIFPTNDNEEQLEAAALRATQIVNEEIEEISDMLGLTKQNQTKE